MSKKTKFIQASFLIPLHEDKHVGDGRLHPATRWIQFQKDLYIQFGAWTLAPGEYKGSYRDPDTGCEVIDISRKYILAVSKREIKRLKTFLRKTGTQFRQKYIYFEAAGKVELLEVEYE